MGWLHRRTVETPLDRLRDAMDVVEVVATRECERARDGFAASCTNEGIRPAAYCLTCRARALRDREDKAQAKAAPRRRRR